MKKWGVYVAMLLVSTFSKGEGELSAIAKSLEDWDLYLQIEYRDRMVRRSGFLQEYKAFAALKPCTRSLIDKLRKENIDLTSLVKEAGNRKWKSPMAEQFIPLVCLDVYGLDAGAIIYLTDANSSALMSVLQAICGIKWVSKDEVAHPKPRRGIGFRPAKETEQ